jgi:helicase
VEGVAVDVVERTYTVNPYSGTIRYGDIMSIAEGTRFHLRSAHRILAALFPDQPDFLGALDVLLSRLEFGLPERALPLSTLRPRLSRGQCLALFQAGVCTSDEMASLGDAQLLACVGDETFRRFRPAVVA